MTQDSTGKAVIDRDYHWQKIDENTPRGSKLQLIHKDSGLAQYGHLSSGDNWFSHWAPLPTFKKEAP